MNQAREQDDREKLPLSKAAEYLLDECRMVLPGIQALFGFQLVAVFNEGFHHYLSSGEQRLHLLAIVLIAIAIAFAMAPAALHRQSGPEEITEAFSIWSRTSSSIAFRPHSWPCCCSRPSAFCGSCCLA